MASPFCNLLGFSRTTGTNLQIKLRKSFYIIFYCWSVLLLPISCKKPVLEVNNDFAGEWRYRSNDAYAYFNIDNNSDGHLHNAYGEIDDDFKGKVRIKNDILKIGKYRFKILMFPAKIDYSQGRDSVYVPYFSASDAQGKPIFATWEMELKSLSPFFPKDEWKFVR